MTHRVPTKEGSDESDLTLTIDPPHAKMRLRDGDGGFNDFPLSMPIIQLFKPPSSVHAFPRGLKGDVAVPPLCS